MNTQMHIKKTDDVKRYFDKTDSRSAMDNDKERDFNAHESR